MWGHSVETPGWSAVRPSAGSLLASSWGGQTQRQRAGAVTLRRHRWALPFWTQPAAEKVGLLHGNSPPLLLQKHLLHV